MSDLTLDQLADMAGDDEGFENTSRFSKKMKLETTYPVKVVKQTIKTAESGYYVLQMELGIIKPDGSVAGGDIVTQCLPVFSDAVHGSKDPEKLKELKKNWGNQLKGVLRATHPDGEFSDYATSSKASGKWKAFDASGREMSSAELKARENHVNKAVIGTAMAMIQEKYSIVGMTCYFVWAPNKKDAANPFANFWSVAPDKYPLAE